MNLDRMRAVREALNLTREDLGQLSGISGRQILRYELGQQIPSADALRALAKALEVSTDYLLYLSDAPTGRAEEAELSHVERRLLYAFRNGDLKDLLRIVVEAKDLAPEGK